MQRIDLNCDVGEGAGFDDLLMPWVTSANVACGAHAGDETTMQATVDLALRHGVAVGAHPGFADRGHFGRRELPLSPREVFELVLGQTRSLQRVAQAQGGRVTHLKVHGALYNLAARERGIARAVAEAAYAADPRLRLVGLAGSELIRAGEARGLAVAREAFADRTYQPDGSLTPRSHPEALVASEDAAVAQVLGLVRAGCVRSIGGAEVAVAADTVCVHGDGALAVRLARRLRTELESAGVEVRPCGGRADPDPLEGAAPGVPRSPS